MAGASNAQLYELLLRIGVDADQIPEAIDRLRELGRAGEDADDGLRRGGGGAMNLKAQLMDVGVQLGSGQNPLLILIQQGPQAAEAIDQMGGATEAWKWAMGGLSAFGPIIAGIAIAAAAGATTWLVYSNAMDTASAATERAAGAFMEAGIAAERMGTSMSEAAALGVQHLGSVAQGVNDNILLLTGTLTAADVAARGAAGKALEGAAPGILEISGRKVAVDESIAAATEGSTQARTAALIKMTEEGVTLDELRAKSAEYGEEMARRTADYKEVLENIELLRAAQNAQAEADRKEAAENKAKAEERKADAEARREAALQARYQNEAQREGAKWAREQNAAEKLLTETALKGTSAQNQLAAAHNARLDLLRRAAQITGDMTMLQSAENAEDKLYLEQLRKINEEEEKKRTLSASGGVDSKNRDQRAGFSDQQAGISAAPGWVALLVEMVKDLEKWGDSSADLHKQIWEGIGNLPKTLNENAGDWVKDGTKQMTQGAMDFILGLVDNIGPIIGGVLSGLVEALIEGMHETTMQLIDWITGKGAAEATAAKTSDGHTATVVEGAYWANIGYDVANWFDSSDKMNDPRYENPEGYAGGTNYIAQDGTYRLHRGEQVWNRSRVHSEAANSGTMAGRARFTGTSIVIDIDTLSEAMSQANAKGIYFGQAAS